MVVSGFLLAMPVKDTVWWDTPGGKAMEHRDGNEANCSLMLYDDSGSVTFEWDQPGKIFVTVAARNWQFPDRPNVPISVQIGDVWLSPRGGSVVNDGVSHGHAVAFSTTEPVDDLLRSADHIAVKTTAGDMSIKLRREKMGVLLAQAGKCRDSVARLGK